MNNGFDMATKEVHSSVLILVDIWVTSSLQILHYIYISILLVNSTKLDQ